MKPTTSVRGVPLLGKNIFQPAHTTITIHPYFSIICKIFSIKASIVFVFFLISSNATLKNFILLFKIIKPIIETPINNTIVPNTVKGFRNAVINIRLISTINHKVKLLTEHIVTKTFTLLFPSFFKFIYIQQTI